MVNNVKAVPYRSYGKLECVHDSIIRLMRSELATEVQRVVPGLRAAAGERNGYNAVVKEMELRGML